MLSREQINHFYLQGWVVLRAMLSVGELKRLREETSALIKRGHPKRSKDRTFQYGPDPRQMGRSVFFRVNEVIITHHLPAVTSLLGNPRLLEAVRQLVQDSPFVSTTEVLVFKLPGTGFGHRWHQDPAPLRWFPSIMAGIYLDQSRAKTGALRVVPRSHLAGLIGDERWLCDLTGGPFETPKATVVIETEPGDVVFHATTLVHGSLWTDSEKLRRTIYFQFDHFRNVNFLPADAWTRREYLPAQERLLAAIKHRQSVYPEESPFEPSLISQQCLS